MNGWFNWSTSVDDSDTAAAAEAFTATITDALSSLDGTERTQLFAKAEDLLIQNAVYVPLGHWVQAYIQSAGLTGTRQGAFTGYVPVAFDEAVEYTPSEATPTA
jgi:ABC-type transport system substrate-binding protein